MYHFLRQNLASRTAEVRALRDEVEQTAAAARDRADADAARITELTKAATT